MANTTNDRWREGKQIPVALPVKAAASISRGDFCDLDASGYVQPCAAGDIPTCIAMETVTGGSSDGDVSALFDTSTQSVLEYPPDAGTVTQALVGKTCDLGGAQSLDIDASTDDCVLIRRVDTVANTAFVSLVGVYSGVV